MREGGGRGTEVRQEGGGSTGEEAGHRRGTEARQEGRVSSARDASVSTPRTPGSQQAG